MLARLSIRDIVLIDRLDIDFARGLPVLTGETGAGKSILLDAFALALGARGDASLVRQGAEQGQVTAMFELPAKHPARALLTDIAVDEPVILRRVQFADGRTRAFVNDQPVSVQALQALGAALVAAADAARGVAEVGPDFVKLEERARHIAVLAAGFEGETADGHVRWIDLSPQQARLVESPLDIRELFTQQRKLQPKAWIFTSATLGDDDKLGWFTAATGLEDEGRAFLVDHLHFLTLHRAGGYLLGSLAEASARSTEGVRCWRAIGAGRRGGAEAAE